jgi:signal transduction histidine kinase
MRHVGRLLVLALVIGVPVLLELWRTYEQANTTARRSVWSLVGLLAEQTERTVQAIDFTLIGMRDALEIAPGLAPHDPAYRATLHHRKNLLPYVLSLFVVGPDGFITQGSGDQARRVSLTDRPYFRVHQEDPEVGLHIGQPLLGRAAGRWFVSFSRRITNADGSFGGVVVAAVQPAYFKQFYERVTIGKTDLIALLLRDGTLLARIPDHEDTLGKSYAASRVRDLAVTQGSGIAWAISPLDGINRLVAYRTVAGGALIVLAGRSEATIYGAWFDHAAVVAGGALLIWGLAAGLYWLWLQNGRREQRAQARSAQVQRLEMMGRIVGGIAHDLGNTVKIARTTFALLKPSLKSEREAMALVEDADRSLKSAFDIIDRLLAFARRQELSPRATNLADLIAGFGPILRQAAGPRIELTLDMARPLICSIDPIQLESALLNLVLNSKDAMPNGGHIVISLREAQAPRMHHKARERAAPTQTWAEIVVRDDGSGMSRDVKERAFEPFFTTRQGGSGLGLSQVLGFVQQSNGDVHIDSKAGLGTTVYLAFPIVPGTVEAPPRSPVPTPPVAVSDAAS